MNKKQIVKNAVKKYTGKGGPGLDIIDRIKSMRENDDRNMRIRTSTAQTQTPFEAIGGIIKRGVKGVKQTIKDRIQAQKNFGERENNKDYYGNWKKFRK